MKQKVILPNAMANIRGSDAYPHLSGQVRFYQLRHCVLVEAIIQGLPATDTGFFGFHIHTKNSCTGADFSDTGIHYNPTEEMHPYHAGDLPPLMSCHSDAYIMVATSRFHVMDILGRTVVVHDMVDDFYTQPAGNAGKKIACGVIHRV